MTLLEKGYYYKIQHLIHDFITSNIDDKDIISAFYASYLIEKEYYKNPLEWNKCTNDIIFKASLSLKLYKILLNTEYEINEKFGKNDLTEKLLEKIFSIVDFDKN